jgi:RNA polymerase sigma-B factor
LVLNHVGLARSLARRFAHHGESADDLEQVALLALVKASRRFDPSLNFTFATFATSCIQGELKRHFRDKTWSMRVPRPVQELYLAVKTARDELGHQLKATPSVREIAQHLGVSEDAVLEAMEAGDAYWPDSLDSGCADDDAGTDVPVMEGGYEQALEVHQVRALLPRLDERERLVIDRIYIEQRTQRAVAEQIGVSQMQISRVLHGAITKLRCWAREQ